MQRPGLVARRLHPSSKPARFSGSSNRTLPGESLSEMEKLAVDSTLWLRNLLGRGSLKQKFIYDLSKLNSKSIALLADIKQIKAGSRHMELAVRYGEEDAGVRWANGLVSDLLKRRNNQKSRDVQARDIAREGLYTWRDALEAVLIKRGYDKQGFPQTRDAKETYAMTMLSVKTRQRELIAPTMMDVLIEKETRSKASNPFARALRLGREAVESTMEMIPHNAHKV